MRFSATRLKAGRTLKRRDGRSRPSCAYQRDREAVKGDRTVRPQVNLALEGRHGVLELSELHQRLAEAFARLWIPGLPVDRVLKRRCRLVEPP